MPASPIYKLRKKIWAGKASCPICFTSEKLIIIYIDGDEDNGAEDNLMVVCAHDNRMFFPQLHPNSRRKRLRADYRNQQDHDNWKMFLNLGGIRATHVVAVQ